MNASQTQSTRIIRAVIIIAVLVLCNYIHNILILFDWINFMPAIPGLWQKVLIKY
jgi:hypothetical protein